MQKKNIHFAVKSQRLKFNFIQMRDKNSLTSMENCIGKKTENTLQFITARSRYVCSSGAIISPKYV